MKKSASEKIKSKFSFKQKMKNTTQIDVWQSQYVTSYTQTLTYTQHINKKFTQQWDSFLLFKLS